MRALISRHCFDAHATAPISPRDEVVAGKACGHQWIRHEGRDTYRAANHDVSPALQILRSRRARFWRAVPGLASARFEGRIKSKRFSETFGIDAFHAQHGANAMPLIKVDEQDRVHVVGECGFRSQPELIAERAGAIASKQRNADVPIARNILCKSCGNVLKDMDILPSRRRAQDRARTARLARTGSARKARVKP